MCDGEAHERAMKKPGLVSGSSYGRPALALGGNPRLGARKFNLGLGDWGLA
jgi:hypothetical protein